MSEKITLDAIGDAMGDKITRMAAELVLERVWMLADTFRPGRSVEEDNLWYVAVTRAKRELLRVEGVR